MVVQATDSQFEEVPEAPRPLSGGMDGALPTNPP
jgi:hypothetical protein